jgi:hypothetical protein
MRDTCWNISGITGFGGISAVTFLESAERSFMGESL